MYKRQAAVAEAERDAERVVELAKGPSKIPVSGAVTLLREDPFTQGPRLFAKHCASCHRYNGHNGRGRVLMTKTKEGTASPTPATAADLGKFGSREWMKTILTDYKTHFAPLKNNQWYNEAVKAEEAGDDVVYLNPDESEMADWSGDRDSLTSDANKENLAALIEYLVSETQRSDLELDAAMVAKGEAIAKEGTWAGEIEGTSCVDCHATIGEDFTKRTEDDTGGYPDLARYGSGAWLRDFISNPGSAQHYGEKNRMPAYADKMTPDELDLLVRWMTGDYFPTQVHDYKAK